MIVAREEIDETLVKITLSDGEGAEYQKIVIRPVQGKTLFYQAEQYRNKQVFHCNLSLEELFRYLEEKRKSLSSNSRHQGGQDGFLREECLRHL